MEPVSDFNLNSLQEEASTMPSEIQAFPFISITEIYEAGKSYGEKAIEAVKETASYTWESLVGKELEKTKPTGIIKDSWDWNKFLSNLLKPPYIFIILGVFGLWVFGIFKKR